MVARCETIGKYLMPVFRSIVAKELITTYKLTQVEAAQKLGTTQAAISQYVNSKRAFKGMDHFSDVLPKIQPLARETAKRLVNQEITSQEVSLDFCRLCTTFLDAKLTEKFEDYTI